MRRLRATHPSPLPTRIQRPSAWHIDSRNMATPQSHPGPAAGRAQPDQDDLAQFREIRSMVPATRLVPIDCAISPRRKFAVRRADVVERCRAPIRSGSGRSTAELADASSGERALAPPRYGRRRVLAFLTNTSTGVGSGRVRPVLQQVTAPSRLSAGDTVAPT